MADKGKKRINSLRNKNDAAFTLLEVIVAIFILAVGVGGAFSLISQTLSVASLIELKLTGSYLAQEGIEIVKNLRDKAWLEQGPPPGIPWTEYLSIAPGTSWEVDYLTQDLEERGYIDPGSFLNIDANNFYSYQVSDNPTKFIRRIEIKSVEPDRIGILIEVKWKERGRSHSIEILEYITNWYE